MVWYCYFFKNFPQFVMIHTVKVFLIVNEAEGDVFLEFSCFFYDPTDVKVRPLIITVIPFSMFIATPYILPSSLILWRRQWHPTPVLLPGKSHGWRSLVGCSPWGH